MEDSKEKCSFRTKFETYLNGLTPSATTSTPDTKFEEEQTDFDTAKGVLETFTVHPAHQLNHHDGNKSANLMRENHA